MVQRPQLLSAVPSRRARGPLRSSAVRGDTRAFATLYERHHQDLYRYCRSILRHEEDARDALQSTFAKAFAALAHEERDFELRPWLFRIAHNEAIDLTRSRRESHDIEDVPEQGSDSLPEQVEQRAELRDLQADLAALPERQRAALVLRELSGLGHDEIATVLDTTPRAVKQVIFEARAALHECREGRAMSCDPVRRALSDGDGRVLRGRKVRAHMRGCDACRSFQTALGQRPVQLAMLAPPLPVAAGAALLGHVLPGAHATGVGGAAAAGSGTAAAGGAAGGLAGGLGAKVAVVAAVALTGTGGAAAAVQLSRTAERPAATATGKPFGPAAAGDVTGSPAGARPAGAAGLREGSARREGVPASTRREDARRAEDRPAATTPAERREAGEGEAREDAARDPSPARSDSRSDRTPAPARREATDRVAARPDTPVSAKRPASRPQAAAPVETVAPSRPAPASTAPAPAATPQPAVATPAPTAAPERPATAPSAPQPAVPSAPVRKP